MFANYISDKELVSEYKTTITVEQGKQPNEQVKKDLSRYSSKDIQKANTKKCSVSLVIKEIQIKIMRYHPYNWQNDYYQKGKK